MWERRTVAIGWVLCAFMELWLWKFLREAETGKRVKSLFNTEIFDMNFSKLSFLVAYLIGVEIRAGARGLISELFHKKRTTSVDCLSTCSYKEKKIVSDFFQDIVLWRMRHPKLLMSVSELTEMPGFSIMQGVAIK